MAHRQRARGTRAVRSVLATTLPARVESPMSFWTHLRRHAPSSFFARLAYGAAGSSNPGVRSHGPYFDLFLKQAAKQQFTLEKLPNCGNLLTDPPNCGDIYIGDIFMINFIKSPLLVQSEERLACG